MSISKILVANRGEIAVRIIKTAQKLGYETVAVFSDADSNAPHVSLADVAVRLGPADIGESYLNMERVLDAAVRSGADAIHPGYGFLSENADFAELVIKSDITWIGPNPESMRIMGNKAAAKGAIANSNVPTVPGYSGDDQSAENFAKAAAEIGYPVMVKAASGGGGRGMRLVQNPSDLASAVESAKSESENAFGSAELLLEKAIVNPRHIEVQVFGDSHGNIIHLGERDCSIQRRHQKVFEEAPSPAVNGDLRQKLGTAAVEAAEAVNYVGAGTVEFLLDQSGEFFFIEMNTRLQVEHPVTEMITGQDLVAWQIAVAEGKPLPLTQDEIELNGHAIEVRLYAEDPINQFLPSIGPVLHWQPPSGEGIRVDHGLKSGMEITPFYDAMIAKIIAHGPTREVAQRRLSRALKQTAVFGLQTNREFLIETNDHPVFAAGEATTSFIAEHWPSSTQAEPPSDQMKALAAVLYSRQQPQATGVLLSNLGTRPTTVRFGDELVSVSSLFKNVYDVQVGEDGLALEILEQLPHSVTFEQDGLRTSAMYAFEQDGDLWLQIGRNTQLFSDSLLAPPESGDGASSGRIIAPMPGAVMRLNVAVGDSVAKGDTLLILEAMKMEHPIPAPFDGAVEEILISEGQQMQPKELMIVIS